MAGLENTCLPGRSQFLSFKEAEVLRLPGATILLDGGLFSFPLLLIPDVLNGYMPLQFVKTVLWFIFHYIGCGAPGSYFSMKLYSSVNHICKCFFSSHQRIC